MLSIHVSCVESCVLTTHFIYMGFFAIIFLFIFRSVAMCTLYCMGLATVKGTQL